jgi:nucleoside-diphosphate-sugar epimerase
VKKALITGAAGFVGSHMMDHLLDDNWQVTATDLLWGTEVANVIEDDLRYDLVIHAAAAGPNRKAIDTQPANFPYNVMLDAAMLEWAIRTGQRHFVYLSSSAVYPRIFQGHSAAAMGRQLIEADATTNLGHSDPFDTYGWTKLFGERMAEEARAAGVIMTVVRTFSGYGEDQTEDFPFRAFVERARRREDPFVIWGNAKQVRDWIHIDDVIAGIMAVVASHTSKIVNICTGIGTSMEELANLVCAAVDHKAKIQVDESAPLGVFYRVGDPTLFHEFYTPKITLEEGVHRAFKL